MANRWGDNGNSDRLYFGSPKSLQMVTATIKLKDLLLGRKAITNLDNIVKGRDITFPTLQFKSINSSVLSFLYGPTLTSTHDHWKNHSFD